MSNYTDKVNERAEELNYETEVKRVYPEAHITWHVTVGQMCGWAVITSALSYGEIISDINKPKSEAWQSAYNTIQSQNKEERI